MKDQKERSEKAEKGSCTLKCPQCKKEWGKMRFAYGEPVDARNVTITAGKKRKLKNGDTLSCSLCKYDYSTFDVWLNISESGGQDG